VTAKYSTDRDTGPRTEWDADTEHILATWSNKPFHELRERYDSVDHRVVVQYHDGVGCDIRWEIRSDDSQRVPDGWTPVETIEVREYGAFHERRRTRWFR